MNKTAKKILVFTGLGLDVALTLFLFVVAIIMIATMPKDSLAMDHAIETNGKFIGYLQQHSTLYLLTCVLPLFVLLAGNIAILILYVRKINKKKEAAIDDLNEEQKAALRAELLKELQSEAKESEEDKKSE
ncbi:MAG: hypothetical protein J5511_05505 [Bacilli bacterium]|nr:hypothetical protein [Bacilli bacterium]